MSSKISQRVIAPILATGFTTARTLQDRFADVVNVKDFGAVGDGVTDDTVSIQAALDYARLNARTLSLDVGVYRTTSTLTLTGGYSIVGHPPVVFDTTISLSSGLLGSWLYFDHTGIGIHIISGRDINFKSFGTCRNQPIPIDHYVLNSWTPNDHDFDFVVTTGWDITLKDLLLLNPTRGITTLGGTNRINLYNIRMSVFKVGIQLIECVDVCRLDQIHIWAFWRDNVNIHEYCIYNLIAISLGRVDNPQMSNIFCLFAHYGIHIWQSSTGTTSKMHLSNCDIDLSTIGIHVDANVTNGFTGQFSNITYQSAFGMINPDPTAIGLQIDGHNSVLEFSNFAPVNCLKNGIRISGNNNRVQISGLHILNYDKSAIGFPAIELVSGTVGNIVDVGNPNISTDVGIGPKFSTTGTSGSSIVQYTVTVAA